MDQRFLQRGEQFSAGYRVCFSQDAALSIRQYEPPQVQSFEHKFWKAVLMHREQYEKTLVEGTDFSLPRKQFIEDSVETNAVHEISETTPIPADNKGYKLLQLMGWSGTGLGKHENGLTAPVDVRAVDTGSRMGLGRAQLEQSIVEAETATRRQLDVEQQMQETETQRQQRMQRAEEREMVVKQVADMNRTFYCEVCCKQYKSIAELEEHLSSYDHHHRKRLQELKQMELERTRDSRTKKESKRQAREQARLEKQIAAAHQGKRAAVSGRGGQSAALHGKPALPTQSAPPLPDAPPLPNSPPPPNRAPPPYASPLRGAPPLPDAPPPIPTQPYPGHTPGPHAPLHPPQRISKDGHRGFAREHGWLSQSQPPTLPAAHAPSSQSSHRVPPPPPPDYHDTPPRRAAEAKPLSLSLSNKTGRMSQKPLQVAKSLPKPRSGPVRQLSMFAADESD